jgi:hypothetical protein
MAKFSDKRMGKEVGAASVYAEPHNMSGASVNVNNVIKNKTGAQTMADMNISVGALNKGNYKPTKTDGITMRGHGAATKGIKSRGPMA